jgi:hypothetical protein
MEVGFMKKPNSTRPAAFALLLIGIISLACAGIPKPWRDYSKKSFDSQQWKAGDPQTRGTMYFDLFVKRKLTGKSKDEVVELLGESDKKTSSEGLEVWLYRIEIVGEWNRPAFPVSFDKNGKAFGGRVKDGTMSMIVEE